MVRECFVWSLLEHENICPFRGLGKLNNFELPVLVSLFIPYGCLEYLRDHPEHRLSAVRLLLLELDRPHTGGVTVVRQPMPTVMIHLPPKALTSTRVVAEYTQR